MSAFAGAAKLGALRLSTATGAFRAGDVREGLKQLHATIGYLRGLPELAPLSDSPDCYSTRTMFTSKMLILRAAETAIVTLLRVDQERRAEQAALARLGGVPVRKASPACLQRCAALGEWLEACAAGWTPSPAELGDAFHAVVKILDALHIESDTKASDLEAARRSLKQNAELLAVWQRFAAEARALGAELSAQDRVNALRREVAMWIERAKHAEGEGRAEDATILWARADAALAEYEAPIEALVERYQTTFNGRI